MSFTVMADVPNPLFDSNGDPFSGAVLKAFLPGTTTSTSIAIDSSGTSPQTSITYNAQGKLEVTGNEILPYIDKKHKWGIFANATDATANTPFYMGPFDNVNTTSTSVETVRPFDTLAAAQAGDGLFDGATLYIVERSTGKAGYAFWEVVLLSTVTVNSQDIVAWDNNTGSAADLALVQLDLEENRSVETVADLKASDFIPGQTVTVQGNKSNKDGGESDYLIKTSAQATTDGDTVDEFEGHTLDNTFVAVLQAAVPNVIQLGFVADGTKGAGTGTDNSAAYKAMVANQNLINIDGFPGVFFFGAMAANEVLAQRITTPIRINWRDAYLIVDSDNTVSSTSASFLKLFDVAGSMGHYTFEDIGWVVTDTGRGVQPVAIVNQLVSTEGYDIGPCHVVSGQSILTAGSLDPANFRARGITLIGSCTADDVFYGVNLADNGDEVAGSYRVLNVVRLIFIYGVRNVYLNGYADTGLASSGNVNISNTSSLSTETKDCVLNMGFREMNGPVLFNTNNNGGVGGDDGKGIIRNVEVNLKVTVNGSNLAIGGAVVSVRSFDSVGATMTTATATMEGIKLSIDTPVAFTNPIQEFTASDNFGLITYKASLIAPFLSVIPSFLVTKGDGVIGAEKTGDTTTTTVDIPIKYFNSTSLTRYKLEIAAQEDTQLAAQKSVIATYDLIGFVSGGTLTLLKTTELHKTIQGGATPVFTITAVAGVKGQSVRIAVSGFASNSGGKISGRLWPMS